VTVLIEERLNTYVEFQPLLLVNGGQELVWWSERDGWGHYYLFEARGRLKNQITSGEFNCRQVVNLDEKPELFIFWPAAAKKVRILILAIFIESISTVPASSAWILVILIIRFL